MKFSDDVLMAYVDGEADPAARDAIEHALQHDPQLAARISRERELRTRLAAAFGSVLEEPVPPHLSKRAWTAPTGGAVLAGSPRWLNAARRRTQQWSWPEWAALAASLLIGVLASRNGSAPPSAPFASVAGQLVAEGALASNLYSLAGSSTDPQSKISVGLSYLAKSGAYCRTFEMPATQSVTGIACRAGEQWRIQALLPTQAQATSEYRMAGSEMPPALLAIVEAESATTLDAEDEAVARARGWRR